MSSMRRRAISGVKWVGISQVSRLICQLLAVIILARLLPPSDFGLIAIATVFTGFAGLFRDFGTAAAIIHKPKISASLLDSIFWLNLLFGLGLTLLLDLLAPAIALGFSEPRIVAILWALTLSFPVTSLGIVHQALLEKASDFRPLAIIESIAAFISLVAAVWAAWAGCGVFSLVLQPLIAALISTVGVWLASSWRPHLCWNIHEIRSVIGFSGNLVGFNTLNYFIRNLDNLLVGRFLGATDLGYYSMAYRLMLLPLQNISSVLGRALFPVLSNMQHDNERLAEAYVRATATIAFITAPLMFGFFVLREPFVWSTLGHNWQPVVNVLGWLVPIGFMQSIGTMVGTLYMATGRTDLMFKWAIAAGLLVIPAFVVGLNWGITGVAAAYGFVSLLLFWPSLVIPFRLVGLRVSDTLLRTMPSVITALLMATIIGFVSFWWPQNTESQWVRLVGLVLLGIVIYTSISMMTQRAQLKEIFHALVKR